MLPKTSTLFALVALTSFCHSGPALAEEAQAKDAPKDETASQIVFRGKFGYSSLSKLTPVTSGLGYGGDIGFTVFKNLGIGATFQIIDGKKESRTDRTGAGTIYEYTAKATYFGVYPTYQVLSSNRAKAYAGIFLGSASISTSTKTTNMTTKAEIYSDSNPSSFAWGPIAGVDIPLAGCFGLSLQGQYITVTSGQPKIATFGALGGFFVEL